MMLTQLVRMWQGNEVSLDGRGAFVKQKLGAWIEKNGDIEGKGVYVKVGDSKYGCGIVGDLNCVVGNGNLDRGHERKVELTTLHLDIQFCYLPS
jgi:hypothetical protein